MLAQSVPVLRRCPGSPGVTVSAMQYTAPDLAELQRAAKTATASGAGTQLPEPLPIVAQGAASGSGMQHTGSGLNSIMEHRDKGGSGIGSGSTSGSGIRTGYTSTQDVVSSCTARGKIAMKHLLRSDAFAGMEHRGKGLNSNMGHMGKGGSGIGSGSGSGTEHTGSGLNSTTEEPATQGEGLGSGTGPPHELVEWTVVDE